MPEDSLNLILPSEVTIAYVRLKVKASQFSHSQWTTDNLHIENWQIHDKDDFSLFLGLVQSRRPAKMKRVKAEKH